VYDRALARIQQKIRNEWCTYAWFDHAVRFLPTPFLTVLTRPRGPVHHVFSEEPGDSRSHLGRSYTSVQKEVKSGCGNIGCFTPAICILIRPSVGPDHAILIYSNLVSLIRVKVQLRRKDIDIQLYSYRCFE